MKEKIETLRSWINTGQVKTANGRSDDDLLTLVNQFEIEWKKTYDLPKEWICRKLQKEGGKIKGNNVEYYIDHKSNIHYLVPVGPTNWLFIPKMEGLGRDFKRFCGLMLLIGDKPHEGDEKVDIYEKFKRQTKQTKL